MSELLEARKLELRTKIGLLEKELYGDKQGGVLGLVQWKRVLDKESGRFETIPLDEAIRSQSELFFHKSVEQKVLDDLWAKKSIAFERLEQENGLLWEYVSLVDKPILGKGLSELFEEVNDRLKSFESDLMDIKVFLEEHFNNEKDEEQKNEVNEKKDFEEEQQVVNKVVSKQVSKDGFKEAEI